MSIQLSIELERRLEAVVARGAYATAQEALDAGVAALELASDPLPEAEQREIELLLKEGIASATESEQEFWAAVDAETDSLLAEHRSSARR